MIQRLREQPELQRFDLDLDLHARWKIQPLQGVDGLGGVFHDVHETLVDAHLEVFATVLVFVRRADHRDAVLLSGQRDRAPDRGSGPQDRLDDLLGGLIEDFVVVRLEADTGA